MASVAFVLGCSSEAASLISDSQMEQLLGDLHMHWRECSGGALPAPPSCLLSPKAMHCFRLVPKSSRSPLLARLCLQGVGPGSDLLESGVDVLLVEGARQARFAGPEQHGR